MKAVDKYESDIKKAPLNILELGFCKLSDMEVELEQKLKEVRDAKVRFMIEIDLRLNNIKQ